ncbi:MAG: methionine adenosyltransferase domain-containing protein, partial [Acidobacteria bacterium]|nr:methionine adenosyltransferase domain-containing protein [Acidobacteriota bacterium]
MNRGITRTAEHVSAGHPDKFCDQVADRVLDEVLDRAAQAGDDLMSVRSAVECLAKDNLIMVTGEMKMSSVVRAELNVESIARQTWTEIGYSSNPTDLTVIDHLRAQSVDIAAGTDDFGAGDQGIMVGYATDENAEMVPQEWLLARNICWTLHRLRESREIPWLRSDCKSQVTLAADGSAQSVIVAAQHSEEVSHAEIVSTILSKVVRPVVGEVADDKVSINGTGRFVIGGPTGDAGVVGRKIVVDAYGPRVPVGGGAYSGKDATKVDRSAAYMARHIAKAVVAHKVAGAKECTVNIAYGIGRHQPEMVTAVIETGEDVSSWVKQKF